MCDCCKNGCVVNDMDAPLKIDIKYHDDELVKIEKIEIGDYVDLRSAETVELKQGEFKLISLGVSMRLPKGYHAMMLPRSSTFKKFGIIQTNSCGIIDHSYQGTNDVWFFPALAVRDTIINKNDRICQFRIIENMPTVYFNECAVLSSTDRGGHGSTGTK